MRAAESSRRRKAQSGAGQFVSSDGRMVVAGSGRGRVGEEGRVAAQGSGGEIGGDAGGVAVVKGGGNGESWLAGEMPVGERAEKEEEVVGADLTPSFGPAAHFSEAASEGDAAGNQIDESTIK